MELLNARAGLVHGDVILARSQVRGRGQGSNRWHASPGQNLTLSVVLEPDHLPVARLFALTQLTGLAVARTVAHFLPDDLAATVRVKWPNDVYVGDRKIAGVLVQNSLRGSVVHWSVLGIGLNVNESAFPAELRGSATALLSLTHGTRDLATVRTVLFQHLSDLYPLTIPDALPELDRLYHQLLYRKNAPTLFTRTAGGPAVRGRIRGVTTAGQLRVALATGEVEVFALREIRLVGDPT